jgi:hypothetical protein
VRGVSYYIRVRGARKVVRDTPESRLMPNEGQHISWHILSRRKKLGLSRHGAGVTLRRRYCRACQGGRLHRVDTRTKVDRWKTLFDYPNSAYLCMTVRGGILADLSNHVGKVYNSAECISIRIAESSVMDSWDDRYLAQC